MTMVTGNAERLAGGRQPLREIAGGIGDDALPGLVGRKLLQPPIGAAYLERSRPLQRFRLDEDARRAGLPGECRRFQQRRHLRRLGGDGVGLLEMVKGGNEKVCHLIRLAETACCSSSTLRSMWLRM